jgi:Telomere length regulation protein
MRHANGTDMDNGDDDCSGVGDIVQTILAAVVKRGCRRSDETTVMPTPNADHPFAPLPPSSSSISTLAAQMTLNQKISLASLLIPHFAQESDALESSFIDSSDEGNVQSTSIETREAGRGTGGTSSSSSSPLTLLLDVCGATACLAATVAILSSHNAVTARVASQDAPVRRSPASETCISTITDRRPLSQTWRIVLVPLLHMILYGTEPSQPDRPPQMTRTIWWSKLPPSVQPPTWLIPHVLALPGLVCGALFCNCGGWCDFVDKSDDAPLSTVSSLMPVAWGKLSSLVARADRHAWHSSLVTAAAAAVVAAASSTGSNDPKDDDTDTPWSLLVAALLRRSSGDQDIATGLYQLHKESYDTAETENNESCHTCRQWTRIVTRGGVSNPLQAAQLCRAFMRLYLRRTERTRGHEPKSKALKDEPQSAWLTVACHWALQQHGAAVCQLVVLSSSSVVSTNERVVDGRLCQLYVGLLSRIDHDRDQDTKNDDANDSEDDCSNDSDVDTGRRALQIEMRQLPRHQQALYQQVCIVAETWATTSFVRRWDGLLQQHVTAFLLAGLVELQQQPTTSSDSKMFFQQSLLIARLMQGITLRLGSSNADAIRRDGMQVGEQIAALLGLDLKFEELHNGVSSESSSPNEAIQENSKAVIEKKVRRKVTRIRSKDWNPDAVYQGSDDETSSESGAFSDDDSEWDVDSDFSTPYDLEDDMEDLRETPRPLYLNECLDLLRTAENNEHIYSRHETALQEISNLVRSRPADLADLGPELARSVLRLENKFDMTGFAEMVAESLCSLTVADPAKIGLDLIAEMFGDCTLSDRLLVLRTLDTAAWELSGLDQGQRPPLENEHGSLQ